MSKGKARRGRRFSPGSLAINALLMLISLGCVYPVVWLAYSSMRMPLEFQINPLALPERLNFENYRTVLFETEMPMWLINTLRNTVLSLALILVVSFVVGYFLARFRFRGRNAIYLLLMFGLLIPLHSLMAPVYVLFSKARLNDQWYTLLFPYVAFAMPTSVYLTESVVHAIPLEVEEAAAIDGSPFSRSLFQIVLPMCRPVLVTVGIINFFGFWNEFAFSMLLINSQKLMTVSVGLTMFTGQFVTNYPKMMAATFLSMLPALLLYAAFSKQIIKGMVAGAVKG